MKALITGAAGAVGYHLAQELVKRGYELTLVDNLERGRRDAAFEALLELPSTQFLQLDLTCSKSLEALEGGYDHVYHLAAVNGTSKFYEAPHTVLRTNTLSLVAMLDWFRTNNPKGKFCFTSSNEAYAGALSAFGSLPLPTPEAVPLVIEDPYNPRWSYAATKLIGELFVIHYAQQYNLRAVVVRPHNFYGPRSGYDHVIPEMCDRIIRRVDPFPIYGTEETRSFCYLPDAAQALRMIMESTATDTLPIQTIHIGSSEEVKIGELAEHLFAVAGWKPANIEKHTSPAGSVQRRLPSITKIRTLVGWEPSTQLRDGLRATYEWYTANPKGPVS